MNENLEVVYEQAIFKFSDEVFDNALFTSDENYYESQITDDEYERLRADWEMLKLDLEIRQELVELQDTKKEDNIKREIAKINKRLKKI